MSTRLLSKVMSKLRLLSINLDRNRGDIFRSKYANRLYYRSLIITCAIGSRIPMSSGLIPFELLPKRKFIEVEVKVES